MKPTADSPRCDWCARPATHVLALPGPTTHALCESHERVMAKWAADGGDGSTGVAAVSRVHPSERTARQAAERAMASLAKYEGPPS